MLIVVTHSLELAGAARSGGWSLNDGKLGVSVAQSHVAGVD